LVASLLVCMRARTRAHAVQYRINVTQLNGSR